MKKIFKIIGVLAGLGILVVVILFALLPWMDRWGATDAEIAASFPGDELVPSPRLLRRLVGKVYAKYWGEAGLRKAARLAEEDYAMSQREL